MSAALKDTSTELMVSKGAPARGARDKDTVLPVLTLVIWTGSLVVGVVGIALPHPRFTPPVKAMPPVTAQLLHVELTTDPLPLANPAPPPPANLIQPPPLPRPTIVPASPPMVLVSVPSPQIAFAVPIEAPAPVVPAREASYRTLDVPVITDPTPAQPAARSLTFGQGEGKQPAPEYPRQALREGQEGSVVVRMTVGEDGRVLAAAASSPSPWPLLNDAAIRVVKSRWRFTPGPVRVYEVSISFQLTK